MDNLSNLNPSSCILSNATKLTNVEIHSSELYNINVTNNKYLRRVDLENCVALGTVTATGSSLNLSNCKYLRYCNVYNTALTEVQLNTSGGSLIEIYYPKTIQNVQLIKQRLLETVGLPYGSGGAEIPTSLYNIDIEECPSIKKLNTSTNNSINNTFASMVYCNNLTLRNALDLRELNFDGFHRLTKVIIENMYNLQVVGFNNLLPSGETSTIKYIGLSNCPLLETIEMNCTSNDYEITFSDGAILNFGGLLALKTITSNCVLKGIKTIVLPLGLESMFFTNEYGSGYSTIQNLWSSAVCNVNTDGATPKATHIDSTYIGIDFANMNLKNIDLGALVNIPKAINFRLSPTTVNPHFNLNRDGETYPYLKPIGTLDLSNYTESLARFFDGVDLDKLQIVCNNNLPQTDLSYCFYNSSFNSLSAIENLLTRVSNITNLDYCFYRTTIDSLNVLNGINMGTNSTMNYTFAECPNIRTLSNITISRNVTSVEGMFKGCPLTSITNITVNVSGSIKGLFMGCSQLTTINTFRIPNVTDLSNVFSGCSNLTTLIGFELPSSVTKINNLFNGCYALTTIENITFSSNITEANTWYPPYLETLQNITINSSAVKLTNCTTLTTIRDFTLGTNDCSSMFEGCTSMTSDIELPSTIVNCSNMFKNCTSITHIHSNWNKSYNNGITSTDCYSGCGSITHIDDINVISYEGDLGLDYVPEAWGGGGFDAEVTSTFEIVVPSDGYEVVICVDPKNGATTNWGDSVLDSSSSHTYSKSGTYIIKTKNKHIHTANAVVTLRNVLTKILKLRKYITPHTQFRGCWKLTSVNLDNCEISNNHLLFYDTFSKVIELSMVNTKLPSDTSKWNYMASSPPNITEIRGIEDLDVSHVVSFKNLFQGFANLTSLDLSRWDTSNATSMENMFGNCSSLTEPPIKNIPNSVTNTANMYYACSSLTEDVTIPISVTDCSSMFKDCTSMTHIHSNWNNSYINEITSTDCYTNCTAITHIDGENVIKSEYSEGLDNVPNEWGGYGFYNDKTTIIEVEIPSDNYSLQLVKYSICVTQNNARIAWGDGVYTSIEDVNSQTSIDCTHVYEKSGTYIIKGHFTFGNGYPNQAASVLTRAFQVCSIRSCQFLFFNCKKLTYANLSASTSTEGINFNSAFKDCSSLETVDGLEYINPTKTREMFFGCTSLKNLNQISNCNFSNATDMSKMFYGCSSLQSLDLSGWNVSNATDMHDMFYNCSSLQSLDLSNWNVSNVTDMNSMFYKCSLLQSLDLTNWDTGSVTNMHDMFHNCSSLATILGLYELNVMNVTNMEYMFSGAKKMLNIDFSKLDTTGVTSFTSICNEGVWETVTYNFNGLYTAALHTSTVTQKVTFKNCNVTLDRYVFPKGSYEIEFINSIIIDDLDATSGCGLNRATLSVESLVSILNALKDYSSGDIHSIIIGSSNLAKLTDTQIAIATNKNWTLS